MFHPPKETIPTTQVFHVPTSSIALDSIITTKSSKIYANPSEHVCSPRIVIRFGHIENPSAISSSFSLVVVQSVDGRSLTNNVYVGMNAVNAPILTSRMSFKFEGLPTKLPFGGARDATTIHVMPPNKRV